MTKSIVTSNEHYIVESDGSVTFTAVGIQHYQTYYEKLGFSVESITTISRLAIANRLIRSLISEEMVESVSRLPRNLESQWLMALIHGNVKEFDRLSNTLQRL